MMGRKVTSRPAIRERAYDCRPFTDRELDELCEYSLRHLISELKKRDAERAALIFAFSFWKKLKNSSWRPSARETKYMRNLIADYLDFGPSDVLED